MYISNVTYTPDTESNYISRNKNYRIFKSTEPITNINCIKNITDDIAPLGSLNSDYLKKYIRYSYNNTTWSLWYQFDIGGDSVDIEGTLDQFLSAISFDGSSLYFEYKYVYDNGENNNNTLEPNVVINSISTIVDFCVDVNVTYISELRNAFESRDESAPVYTFNYDSNFNAYDIGSFKDLYRNMSYMITKSFGYDCLYFQTKPDVTSGDFIFKEWNLFEFTTRKCVKFNTVKNQFPDNMPIFNTDNDNWEEPFDIHIDDYYFKSIFGPSAEPRKKDVIYVPINNRAYQINGAYLQRTFMNEPTFWVINVIKHKPNIDYIKDNEHTRFLDNILLSHKDQFTDIMNEQLTDVVSPQQTKTISVLFDETRESLVSNLKVPQAGKYYNYSMLIDYYYDFSNISDFSNPAVLYKHLSYINSERPNLTYYAIFNITGVGELKFLNGVDLDNGINIVGDYGVTTANKLKVSIHINELVTSNVADNISVSINTWYVIFVTISQEFSQVGLTIYELLKDESDTSNFYGISLIENKMWSKTISDFESTSYYQLVSSNMHMANIRLFNKTFGDESHEFIISSLFYRKESDLLIIDNCRPELNVPYIMRLK